MTMIKSMILTIFLSYNRANDKVGIWRLIGPIILPLSLSHLILALTWKILELLKFELQLSLSTTILFALTSSHRLSLAPN